MNIKPPDKVLKHAISAWLNKADYELIVNTAKAGGVSTASYLRAVLMSAISPDRELDHAVKTWLSFPEYELISDLAKESGVSVQVYVRSVLIDAIADEKRIAKPKKNGHVSNSFRV